MVLEDLRLNSNSTTLNKRKTESEQPTTLSGPDKKELKSKNKAPKNENTNKNESGTLSIFSISGFIRLFSIPIRYFYNNIIGLIKFTWSLLGLNQPQNTDPLQDILNFIKNFENTFGESHPEFYNGSYSSAVTEAKRDLKFLVVYLHNDLHEDTDNFCRQVLIHQEVINYIKRNNLIFWACSINLREGYLVSKIMRENTYPFLALVALKNNKMIIAKKFQGKTSVEKLLSQLQKAIEENEASMISSRLDRQQRNMDQLIRKQQDQDYLDSLKADQEKERKRKEEIVKREKEQQEKLNLELEEKNKKENLIRLKDELKDQVISEPADLKSPDVIKLLIKLPNGKKLERRFLKSNSIKHLFYFVFCHSESPLKFTIKTSFPARELPCSTPDLQTKCVQSNLPNCEPPTFEKFGIKNSEVLYVHDLEA